VLAGAGLGDDALLAHALREQGLPEGVVDLVRPGVEEVLALEVDLRPPAVLRVSRSAKYSSVGRPANSFRWCRNSCWNAGSTRACW
jgi:hypothetical protein